MDDALTTERIFDKWLAGAGYMSLELDRDFVVVQANRLFISAFGNPVGMKCYAFISGRDELCPDCPVKAVFSGAERAVVERVWVDKRGVEVCLSHTAVAVKNEAGDIIGASELIVDSTQRRRTERWLRDSERRYRTLLAQVPDIIFIMDHEGRLTYLNNEVERFLGYSMQELLETPLEDYVAPEDRPWFKSVFQLRPPEAIWDHELAIIDSQGQRKYARIRCKASIMEDSPYKRFEGVMRDITLRKTLEQELKSSREELLSKIRIIDELYENILQSEKTKALEQHTTEVAHELRQPLSIVGGFARRMIRQLETSGEINAEMQKACFKIIIREIERLEKILNNLIDFTRREIMCLQKTNPNHLVDYVLNINEERMAEAKLRLESHLHGDVPELLLDPGRFQQVIRNLVANAIEASPIGGLIRVATRIVPPENKGKGQPGHSFFEFKIVNRGNVIPPDQLLQIFNPFFTTKQHGTGVGLTLSKKIVEDHCGSISVKSDEQGTEFTVRIPVTTQPASCVEATGTPTQ